MIKRKQNQCSGGCWNGLSREMKKLPKMAVSVLPECEKQKNDQPWAGYNK
ncbi:MAG: hypothetical protein LC660_18630 [Desulfobacteraceae bacterium]|nr:hypothetical protein [Desulfobacteraceae bacterium]